RIEELVAKEEFSGVVLLARDGEVLYEKAAGLANRDQGVANTAATRFNVGSITKAFTQVALAQLAAAGKLSLDDKLIQSLPDYPDRAIAEQVTLQQLLAHRSGLGDIFNERFTPEARAGLRTLADHLPLFTGKPLEFAPGARQRYSNAGYVVLGLVVERLSGQSFADYVRDRIFVPAGMKDSAWLRRDALPAGAAVGYTREGWQEEGRASAGGARHSNSGDLPAIGSSAGGSYSTARDLLAFDRALAARRLGGPERYAEQGGLGIAGGTGGANATLESDWESGWTIIVLANFDPPAAESLTRELRALVARLAPASAPSSAPSSAPQAERARGSRAP
ncbi:MAG: serine hydrolase domain-containing protein, partial [Thermoanaerobaculia bacterium]